MGKWKASKPVAQPPVCWICDKRLWAGGRSYSKFAMNWAMNTRHTCSVPRTRSESGLGQRFCTQAALKARGYAFAFRYGSEALAQALAWLDFPGLRQFRKRIETGPIDLRDTLDAAFRALDEGTTLAANQLAVLEEHTGGWFGQAAEMRRLLCALRAQP